MRVAHYLIRAPSGLFYFRLRVPLALRPALRMSLIKRALGTRCPRTALALATLYAARYAHSFAMLRRGEAVAKVPTIDEIRRNLGAPDARGAEYVIKGGPGGFEVHADGADDHARAMEAIANIGRIGPGSFSGTSGPSREDVGGGVPAKRISLEEARLKWEKAIKNTDPKTVGAKRRAVKDFLDWKQGELDEEAQAIGGANAKASPVSVDEIDRQAGGDWFIFLNGQRKRDPKPGGRGQLIPAFSPGTMENKFIYAAGFFDWATTNGYYPRGADNPMRGHANVAKRVKKARARSHGAQLFDPEQISTMFSAENLQRMRRQAARWMALLLLYTGARSNEIGRLELADIYEFPKGCMPGTGTKVFSFSRVGDDKSLKNEHSARLTPIHPDLVALGFWEVVERRRRDWQAQEAQLLNAWRAKAPAATIAQIQQTVLNSQKLFPGLTFDAQNGPANAPQTAFRRMLREAGIKARGDGTFGHHSFRDTVIDKMKHAGVPEEVRDEYTGHANGDGENAAAYESNFSPAALAKLCHPALCWGLALDALKPLVSEGQGDAEG